MPLIDVKVSDLSYLIAEPYFSQKLVVGVP